MAQTRDHDISADSVNTNYPAVAQRIPCRRFATDECEQTVTVNGTVYQASDVGDLSGEVKFKSTVPYLGIGWGNVAGKNGNFHFVADIGVELQGSPDVKLHGSCTAAFAASNPSECAQLNSDVAQEEKDLNDQVSDYKWWPVLNIGVAYRF